jgi:hypothetical protein
MALAIEQLDNGGIEVTWSDNRLRLVVALLLVISAALFAVGTTIEHSQRGDHHDENALSSSESGGEPEAERTENSEKIAGIDPESWPLVGLAIAVSLALAAGVYWRAGRWFVAALGFGIVFAAGDTRELVHQLDESRTAVAVIAAILIPLHLLVAATAGIALMRREQLRPGRE